MDKYLLSNNCFKPFNLEENNSKKRPPKNILGNSEKYIKDDNSISRSDEKLSELNTSIENNDNENESSDDNSQEFINKNIVDLSFLDSMSPNETEDKSNMSSNNININNSNIQSFNYNHNNFQSANWNCNNSRSEYLNENIEKNNQMYKMMLLNNIYQRYNYYKQLAYMNNMNNLMRNYQQMNNNNPNILLTNNNLPQQNIGGPKKANTSNQGKKSIDKKYLINLMDIKTNKERRTTVRMMNIPSYFRPLDLAKKLDEKFGISPQKENRVYDFIYIPFKENKKKEGLINSGYAFINFVHPKHILKFYSLFQGKHLKLKTSGKVCIITFASRQGTNIKNQNFEDSSNDKYIYFSDTKNHFQLLTD